MSRKKLSEYKAKSILYPYLSLPLAEFPLKPSTKASDIKLLAEKLAGKLGIQAKFVVKVDQGVKKRGKSGLLQLNLGKSEVTTAAKELFAKGYDNLIVSLFLPHTANTEKYLALSRTRTGVEVLYSPKGGVDVESNAELIKKVVIKQDVANQEARSELARIAESLQVDVDFLEKVLLCFSENHFSFLEINPLVVEKRPQILDLAVEVDSAAAFAVKGRWKHEDFVQSATEETSAEISAIKDLDANSQASLKLELLNPKGQIWMLLSGGGASIVLADELYNLGMAGLMANYGEYSGNPNSEETYIYTRNIISLLLQAKAKPKAIVIAGGVANFTDVRVTFKGIIRALKERAKELAKHQVKVFVRRGGPHAEEGLATMRQELEGMGLLGEVHGPDLPLTEIVSLSLKHIKK